MTIGANNRGDDKETPGDIDQVLAKLQDRADRAEGFPEESRPNITDIKAHYLKTLVADKVGAALLLQDLTTVANATDSTSLQLSESFIKNAGGIDAIREFIDATPQKA